MSRREIIAYAISHAPKGVKGGPYEAHGACGTPAPTLDKAMRWHDRPSVSIYGVRRVVPHARMIRIVRAQPSSEATMETTQRRLAAVAEHMTEHAYQEMASALDVDACRVGPSEASAVQVLRELVAECDDVQAVWWRTDILAALASRARAVLADAAGPDPMPVVRAALKEECARVRMDRAEHGIGDFAALETAWLKCVEATRVAVGAYRKAGGK